MIVEWKKKSSNQNKLEQLII